MSRIVFPKSRPNKNPNTMLGFGRTVFSLPRTALSLADAPCSPPFGDMSLRAGGFVTAVTFQSDSVVSLDRDLAISSKPFSIVSRVASQLTWCDFGAYPAQARLSSRSKPESNQSLSDASFSPCAFRWQHITYRDAVIDVKFHNSPRHFTDNELGDV